MSDPIISRSTCVKGKKKKNEIVYIINWPVCEKKITQDTEKKRDLDIKKCVEKLF